MLDVLVQWTGRVPANLFAAPFQGWNARLEPPKPPPAQQPNSL